MNGTVDDGRVDDGTVDDGTMQVEITPKRLDELIRWHGTDESALPPAHTLHNLSRDTVAALHELGSARETIERLRAAMSRAFWAASRRELNAILLEALGPPPEDGSEEDPPGPQALGGAEPKYSGTSPTRIDTLAGRGLNHAGALRPLASRIS